MVVESLSALYLFADGQRVGAGRPLGLVGSSANALIGFLRWVGMSYILGRVWWLAFSLKSCWSCCYNMAQPSGGLSASSAFWRGASSVTIGNCIGLVSLGRFSKALLSSSLLGLERYV